MNFNPITLGLLVAWVYSGVYAIRLIDQNSEISGKGRAWINLFALLAGPATLLLFYLKEGLLRAKANFGKMLTRTDRRREADIVILDSRGQSVFEGSHPGDTGEAIFRAKWIVYEALCKRASDIFFDPKPNGTVVIRFRVDGTIKTIDELEMELGISVVSAIKVAASMDITEKRRPQDGAFSCESGKGPASFRVASVGAFGGEKITIRVLSNSAGPMSLKDAGLTGENLKILQNAARMPNGMILICGPTGSGKTSTLYALLQTIDFTLKNVISIEDPIEHVVANISQMEVNNKADITFAKLLRNALRQNPDIICLGEIRDEETAQVSSHAAQTGHLIIATVHSNDNLGTIDRLINLGVPMRSIAAMVQLIVSQRLVRRLCPACRKPAELTPQQLSLFEKAKISPKNVHKAVGCRSCDGSGYAGRIALFDLLVMNNSLRAALESEGATLSSIKLKIEAEHGSSILVVEGLKQAAAGMTSMEEVERVTLNLED